MNNIFILGPVASGKNTLLDIIVKEHDVVALDTGRIFRYIAYKLCEKFENETDIENINQIGEQEMNALLDKIYHSTKYINSQLQLLRFDGYNILENEKKLNINYLYEKRVNCLLPIIAKISTIRNMVLNFIEYCLSSSDKPIIMTGHNIKEIDTTKFTVVYLDVDEKTSAYRLYERNKKSYDDILDAFKEVLQRNQTDKIQSTKNILPFLYNYIYINTDNKTEEEVYDEFISKMKICKEKNDHFQSMQSAAINRNDFKWLFNPFMEPIKDELTKLTQTVCLKYPYINQNDLIYQTLILISSCKACELYNCCDLKYLEIVEAAIDDRKQEIINDFMLKVNYGLVKINYKVLDDYLQMALKKLLNLYSSDSVKNIMIKYNSSTTKGNLKSNNGLLSINNTNNNRTVYFKIIDVKTSTFLSKYCHYLHTPRQDEFLAYGAYVENEDNPIAYVSFSKIDRDYKKQLLYNLGIEPQNCVEMTRAWCSNSAPQNIMSSLFQYSINDLSKKWAKDSEYGLVDKKLQAVTTAINPNLGFKASSFFGCNFIPVALRKFLD